MPPTVFVAAPRIAGCSYEPIILRPVDLSGYEDLPNFQGFNTDLPPPGTGNQQQQINSDEEDEPEDSSFDEEYAAPAHEMRAPHV